VYQGSRVIINNNIVLLLFCRNTSMIPNEPFTNHFPHQRLLWLQLPAADLLIPVQFELVTSGSLSMDADNMQHRVADQISWANLALKGRLPGCRGNCQDTRIRLVAGNCIHGSLECPPPPVQVCRSIICFLPICASYSQPILPPSASYLCFLFHADFFMPCN
jgi:hypothetical protein